MADGGKGGKRVRLSTAERRERLAELMQRRTKLTEEEVALLGEVFPALLVMYRPDVLRYLQRRRSLTEADADDAAQEVFLSLHRQIVEDGFPQESLRAKLYWIARGVTSHALRAQDRDPVSIGMPSSGSEPPKTPPDLDRAMDLRWVAPAALAPLTDAQRDVVELADLDDLSHAEVAEVLALPLGTVKSRLSSARRRMLERIEQILPPNEIKAL